MYTPLYSWDTGFVFQMLEFLKIKAKYVKLAQKRKICIPLAWFLSIFEVKENEEE